MKKAIAVLLSLTIAATLTGTMSMADTGAEVEGLAERMDALFLKNCVSEEEIAQMNQQYIDSYTEAFWNMILPGLKNLGRMKTDSDEEELAWWLNYYRLNFNDAVRVTCVNSLNYWEQYAQSGNFDYLFGDQQYWAVPGAEVRASLAKYSMDGQYIEDLTTIGNPTTDSIVIREDAMSFLRDTARIEQLLLEKNETAVTRCELFCLTNQLGFLYIQCGEREYLVKINDLDSAGHIGLPNIELYKIYPASEVMQEIANTPNGIRLSGGVSKTKPTYEAEGEALMAAGLIQGNENGLDPLKPLSRMEATTILVRALGFENEPTQATSQFVDIPDGSWGVKYANIAADKGITVGVGDNKFAPDQLITANEFATLMLRSSNAGEFDWQQAVDLLIERGLLTQEQADKMDLFTRGDMAKIIYEARENGLI